MTTATQIGAVLRVPIGHVKPGPNARGDIGDVTELAMSIRAIGMQKPLLVYTTGPDEYEVFDGHRRLAASHLAHLSYVDIIVRVRPAELVRLKAQLAMHGQARPYDPMAEAEAVHELVFTHCIRHEEVARALGKSPAWVTQRLALLNLDQEEREELRRGGMTLQSAAAIVAQRRALLSGTPRRFTTRTADRAAVARPRLAGHCRTCTCAGAP